MSKEKQNAETWDLEERFSQEWALMTALCDGLAESVLAEENSEDSHSPGYALATQRRRTWEISRDVFKAFEELCRRFKDLEAERARDIDLAERALRARQEPKHAAAAQQQ